jgi:hypothetical protein
MRASLRLPDFSQREKEGPAAEGGGRMRGYGLSGRPL